MPNLRRHAPWLASLALAAFPYSFAHAATLNDTGQTQCFDGSTLVACSTTNAGDASPYPRQDGRYGRDAQARAAKLDARPR